MTSTRTTYLKTRRTTRLQTPPLARPHSQGTTVFSDHFNSKKSLLRSQYTWIHKDCQSSYKAVFADDVGLKRQMVIVDVVLRLKSHVLIHKDPYFKTTPTKTTYVHINKDLGYIIIFEDQHQLKTICFPRLHI